MLQLKSIKKVYKTNDLDVIALNNVSIDFRKSEFVSILGPSGCGKTTLLNIIGGLDKYTEGDLIIDNKSTKKFKSTDFDSYRNHQIGFVFQSYNLIIHQSVLANVELALTLSGVSKKERRKRAIEALDKVGLHEQINKRPNQLSGGQMQRVAIARAIVNNPEIILADEPTGALDSKTSLQIMNLLKEISKEKLIIMVTHNEELAYKYSTRVVKLLDGNIIEDTNPYKIENNQKEDFKVKKIAMSFLTALSLSFNNLLTKKGRTILTSFAGSIGIIGIALILSLSNGVNNYIKRVEEDALSSYPLIIEKTTFSTDEIISSLMTKKEKTNQELDKIYSNDIVVDMLSNMTKGIKSNNLKDFKTYLDNNTKIKDYVLDINYKYNITLNIYKNNKDKIIKVNPNDLFSSLMGNNNYQSSYSNYNVFTEMLDNQEVLKNQYEVLAGKYATEENELMLITNSNNEISDYVLYTLGIKDQMELQSIIAKVMKGESVSVNKTTYNYDDLLNLEYKLVLPTSYYQKVNNKYNKIEDEEGIKKLIQEGMTLKIVGIIKEKENATSLAINGSIAYNKKLIQKVIQEINNSQIVKDQLNNKNINILTNEKFDNLTTYEDILNQLNVYDFDNPSSINLYMKDFESKKSVVKLINEYNKKQR